MTDFLNENSHCDSIKLSVAAWYFVPLHRAWRSDMNISESPEIQVPSHFTCYQGHCNDWHLRDEAPAGDSMRTSCMNINVVLSNSAALGWTEGPLTQLWQKSARVCQFIKQPRTWDLRTHSETLHVAQMFTIPPLYVGRFNSEVACLVHATIHTILAPVSNTVKAIWALGISVPQKGHYATITNKLVMKASFMYFFSWLMCIIIFPQIKVFRVHQSVRHLKIFCKLSDLTKNLRKYSHLKS